jgi:non-specific serine/threonine protein kinase
VIEIDEALRRATEMDYRWIVPEILRIKGELLLQHGGADPAVIVDVFGQSMRQARGQQALYWELCIATSLAEVLQSQRRHLEARAVLTPICDRFVQGFSVSRVKRAKALLDLLA